MADAPREISGKTVLWALVALGTNTGMQNSPADRHYFVAFDSLSPASSSPIVCVIDLCVAAAYIVCGMQSGLSLREAMGFYVEECALVPVGPNAETSWSVYILKLAFFVLGVVPQALKLFAASGIPVAQVLGSIFLATYLVRAAITSAYQPPAHFTQIRRGFMTEARLRMRNMDERIQYAYRTGIGSQLIVISLWGLDAPELVMQTVFFDRTWLSTTIISCLGGVMTWYLWQPIPPHLRTMYYGLMGGLYAMAELYAVNVSWFVSRSGGLRDFLELSALLITSALFAYPVAKVGYGMFRWLMNSPSVQLNRRGRLLMVLFALFNLLGAFMYFNLAYDDFETYQYSWADVMG